MTEQYLTDAIPEWITKEQVNEALAALGIRPDRLGLQKVTLNFTFLGGSVVLERFQKALSRPPGYGAPPPGESTIEIPIIVRNPVLTKVVGSKDV